MICGDIRAEQEMLNRQLQLQIDCRERSVSLLGSSGRYNKPVGNYKSGILSGIGRNGDRTFLNKLKINILSGYTDGSEVILKELEYEQV